MIIKESIEKFVEEILANEDNELKIIDLGKIETEFSQKIILLLRNNNLFAQIFRFFSCQIIYKYFYTS